MTISIDVAWEISPPAKAKNSNPSWKTLRRPWISPKRPIAKRKMAIDNMNEVSTKPNCNALAENSRPMTGRAIPTADIMNGLRKCAMQMENKMADLDVTLPVIDAACYFSSADWL